MIDHFSKVCEQSAQQQSQQGLHKRFDTRTKNNQQHTNQTKNCLSLQTEAEVNTEEFLISSIGMSHKDDSWYVIIYIDGSPVRFKVDTGAQCNVLPKQIFDKVVPNLQPGPKVTAYNRQPVNVVGQQQLGVLFNNVRVDLSCVVAENVDIPVLGLPSCKALNVVKLVDSLKVGTLSSALTETSVANLISKYESVFTGIG